jgi:hypothetical protein
MAWLTIITMRLSGMGDSLAKERIVLRILMALRKGTWYDMLGFWMCSLDNAEKVLVWDKCFVGRSKFNVDVEREEGRRSLREYKTMMGGMGWDEMLDLQSRYACNR